MNTVATMNESLSSLILKLQQEKNDLSVSYTSAIQRGDKYQSIKTLYLTLQEVDKKLRDLTRVTYTVIPQ